MFSSEKLKLIREKNGSSQTAVAKFLGVTRSAYSSWEKGIHKPNSKNLEMLAKFFGVDVDEFKSNLDIVHKYLRLNKDNQIELIKKANELFITELTPYRVHASLSAGVGKFYDNDYEYDTAYFDKEIRYDVASWIHGDSMEPKYHDGDVALIIKTGFDYNGLVYALVLNEKTYIKKVFIEDDKVRLVSLNDKYSDIIDNLENIQIVGKVIASFRPIEV